MNLKSKRKFRLRTRFFVPAVFILAIALVTLLFPRQGDFKYSFSEGRPWQYGLLTAPFDFPIYKPADQLKAERDSILRFYEPYYTIDESVEKNAMAEFDADVNLNTKLSSLSPDYVLYLRNSLQKIYRSGIMRSEDYDKVFSSETQSMRLRKGNLAESKSVETFSTIKSAYEQLLDNTPKSMDAELIRLADVNKYIRENIVYDASTSEKAREEFIQQVSPSTGMVQTGQRIIDQGEIVNSQTYQVLNSLKRVTEERSGRTGKNGWMIFGQLLLVVLLFGAFYAYLLFFRPHEYRNRKHVTFMVLLVTSFVALTAITSQLDLFNVYIIPYAIVTILIRTFIDSRTALFASLITIILSSLMVPFPFEFIVIQIAVAMVSVFMLKELSERYQLIRSSFFILIAYSLMYIGLVMHQEGNINKIDPIIFIYFFINFIFILFSYSLVYLIEKSFGFISGVSLIELSNINKPLLKELSEKAPGTFQHSLQVSNLGMAAAVKIGANASLIRTGALYHDIAYLAIVSLPVTPSYQYLATHTKAKTQRIQGDVDNSGQGRRTQLHFSYTSKKSGIDHLYHVLRQQTQQDRRTYFYNVPARIHIIVQ